MVHLDVLRSKEVVLQEMKELVWKLADDLRNAKDGDSSSVVLDKVVPLYSELLIELAKLVGGLEANELTCDFAIHGTKLGGINMNSHPDVFVHLLKAVGNSINMPIDRSITDIQEDVQGAINK